MAHLPPSPGRPVCTSLSSSKSAFSCWKEPFTSGHDYRYATTTETTRTTAASASTGLSRKSGQSGSKRNDPIPRRSLTCSVIRQILPDSSEKWKKSPSTDDQCQQEIAQRPSVLSPLPSIHTYIHHTVHPYYMHTHTYEYTNICICFSMYCQFATQLLPDPSNGGSRTSQGFLWTFMLAIKTCLFGAVY